MNDDLLGTLIDRHRDAAIAEARRELADDIAKAEASGDPAQQLAVWLLLRNTAMLHLNRLVHADEMAWHRAEQPDKLS